MKFQLNGLAMVLYRVPDAARRDSHDDYDESVFSAGLPIGTCQDALDTACGLYLNDPTAWA